LNATYAIDVGDVSATLDDLISLFSAMRRGRRGVFRSGVDGMAFFVSNA
jgi:hypothetical protein